MKLMWKASLWRWESTQEGRQAAWAGVQPVPFTQPTALFDMPCVDKGSITNPFSVWSVPPVPHRDWIWSIIPLRSKGCEMILSCPLPLANTGTYLALYLIWFIYAWSHQHTHTHTPLGKVMKSLRSWDDRSGIELNVITHKCSSAYLYLTICWRGSED